MKGLKTEIVNDSDYAWTWQSNLAMCVFEEGVSKPAANRAAAKFMNLLFDVDMTIHKSFKNTQIVDD